MNQSPRRAIPDAKSALGHHDERPRGQRLCIARDSPFDTRLFEGNKNFSMNWERTQPLRSMAALCNASPNCLGQTFLGGLETLPIRPIRSRVFGNGDDRVV